MSSGARDQDRTDGLPLTKAMQPLFHNSLAGLFSGVGTAFTGRWRLGPTARADQRRRISADFVSRQRVVSDGYRSVGTPLTSEGCPWLSWCSDGWIASRKCCPRGPTENSSPFRCACGARTCRAGGRSALGPCCLRHCPFAWRHRRGRRRPGRRCRCPTRGVIRRTGRLPARRSGVGDAARMLYPAAAAEHRGAEDHAAVFLEDVRPHDQIGVGGFVFERDEHDALGRTWHLAHSTKSAIDIWLPFRAVWSVRHG